MEIQKRLSESVFVYASHSDGLLASLYNIKFSFDVDSNGGCLDSVVVDGTTRTAPPTNDKPKLLVDNTFQNVIKTLTKKFPELPDLSKVQGCQALLGDSKLILNELLPIYNLLKDISDFTDIALSMFQSFEKLAGLNHTNHFIITLPFFKLLTNFVNIHLAVSELGSDKKAIVSTVAILYSQIYGQSEPSFNKISKYILDYEKPHANIPEVLAPIGGFVMSLLQTYYTECALGSFISVEMLRKDNAFSVIANLKTNYFEDRKLRLLPGFNQFALHVLIISFCFPAEILKVQGCSDILKLAVSNNISFPTYRSEYFNTLAEFETLSKTNSKISKIKSIISDNIGTAFLKSVSFHADKREYLRFSLKQIFNICTDRPNVLVFKLPIIEALLALAREELKWYFSNLDRVVSSKYPKLGPKSPNVNQGFDQQVFELISLLFELKNLISEHKTSIAQYYAQMFRQVYGPALQQIVENMLMKNAPSEDVVENLESIVATVLNCTAEANFESLRLNYSRLLIYFHAGDSSIAISTVVDFVNMMNEIYSRSVYIDQLTGYLDQIVELDFLYYYRPLLLESVEDILLNNIKQIAKLDCIPKLANEFLRNGNNYYPKEIERIGNRSVEFSANFFTILSIMAGKYFQTVVASRITFDNQILAESASKFAPDRRDKKSNKKNIADPLQEAGWESLDSSSSSVSSLQNSSFALANLVSVFDKYQNFRIYNASLAAHEFLKESLTLNFKSFINNYAVLEDSSLSLKDQVDEQPFGLKKPSTFLNELYAYLSAVEYLDSLPLSNSLNNIDFHEFIHDLLKEQTLDQQQLRQYLQAWDTQTASVKQKTKFRKLNLPQNNSNNNNNNISYPAIYIMWYSEVVRDKALAGVEVLSLMKKSITSSTNSGNQNASSNFQAKFYLNFDELCAFCELVGPVGVQILDERLVNGQLAALVKDIKDIVALNQDLLQSLETCWNIPGKVEESLKKIKQFDDFVQKSIAAGFILGYRRLIADALEFTMEQKCGVVYRVVRTAHDRYPSNVFGLPEFRAVDNLANFLGIKRNIDIQLRNSLQAFCRNPTSDLKIFSLMPLMFALVTRHFATEERSVYNIAADVFDNNAHLLPLTINALLTNLTAITDPNNIDTIAETHSRYVKISANLLLRLYCDKESESVKSAMILLYKFADVSDFLPKSDLEDLVPYAMVRQVLADFMRKSKSFVSKRQKEEPPLQENQVAEAGVKS